MAPRRHRRMIGGAAKEAAPSVVTTLQRRRARPRPPANDNPRPRRHIPGLRFLLPLLAATAALVLALTTR